MVRKVRTDNLIKNQFFIITYIKSVRINKLIKYVYIIPTDPAVKPTARKKTNSSKSLGKEFTIRLR